MTGLRSLLTLQTTPGGAGGGRMIPGEFLNDLAQVREAQGMTRLDVVREANGIIALAPKGKTGRPLKLLTANALHGYELGLKIPWPGRRKAIAQVLKTTPDALWPAAVSMCPMLTQDAPPDEALDAKQNGF